MVETEEVMMIVVVFMLALFLCACMNGAINETILLGDEVRTTDRYTDLFNDSFSGKVVMKTTDGIYTVWDDNGTERTFERHWLNKVDAEEVI